MTNAHEPASTDQDKGATTPSKRVDNEELDAEIVRDLEADKAADDVRGGCGTSQTHPT